MITVALDIKNILDDEILTQAAGCLKVMAHPVRLKIVDILLHGEFAVNEITQICNGRPHQICEHLRLMQSHGLLSSERRGRSVYYKIENPQLPGIISCIRTNCGV